MKYAVPSTRQGSGALAGYTGPAEPSAAAACTNALAGRCGLRRRYRSSTTTCRTGELVALQKRRPKSSDVLLYRPSPEIASISPVGRNRKWRPSTETAGWSGLRSERTCPPSCPDEPVNQLSSPHRRLLNSACTLLRRKPVKTTSLLSAL